MNHSQTQHTGVEYSQVRYASVNASTVVAVRRMPDVPQGRDKP